MPQNEIMIIQEVADFLRVSERTIYDWAMKGKIPCGKLGGIWRFKRSEIEKWVDKNLCADTLSAAPSSIVIKDILAPERILMFDKTHKKEALSHLIDSLADIPGIKDKKELTRAIFNREELMSTGIGLGIAIPHVRLDSIYNISMAVGVAKSEIVDYDSLDGEPVRIIVMIIAGKNQHTQHIKTVAAISKKLKDEQLRQSLVEAENSADVLHMLS